MRFERLPSLDQGLEPGKDSRPSVRGSSIGRAVLSPLIMDYRHFGGLGLWYQIHADPGRLSLCPS
jgi:hypothetical protein